MIERKQRFQLWAIMDDQAHDSQVTITLHQLSHFKEAEKIWAWLIRNKKTGKAFKTFAQEHGWSPMRIVARINKAIVEEFTVRP